MNRIANGHSIMIPIPAGGCQSGGYMGSSTVAQPGQVINVGNDLVGVPEGSYAPGTAGNMTLLLDGAYGNMLLNTGDTPIVGDKLYVNTTPVTINDITYPGVLTTTAGDNVFAGWCYSLPVVGATYTTVGLLLKKG